MLSCTNQPLILILVILPFYHFMLSISTQESRVNSFFYSLKTRSLLHEVHVEQINKCTNTSKHTKKE